MKAADYLDQLQSLLPPGPAWTSDPGATFTRQLDALSQELARVDGRAIALALEANPYNADELLSDWERVAGLPDPCVGPGQTLAQRRAALVAKLSSIGGQSPAYFISLAFALGYTVTITEFRPHTVDDDVDHALLDTAWAYSWQVNAALNTVVELTVDDDVDTALASWSNAPLECVINRYKPAHTRVLFSYT